MVRTKKKLQKKRSREYPTTAHNKSDDVNLDDEGQIGDDEGVDLNSSGKERAKMDCYDAIYVPYPIEVWLTINSL